MTELNTFHMKQQKNRAHFRAVKQRLDEKKAERVHLPGLGVVEVGSKEYKGWICEQTRRIERQQGKKREIRWLIRLAVFAWVVGVSLTLWGLV